MKNVLRNMVRHCCSFSGLDYEMNTCSASTILSASQVGGGRDGFNAAF